MYHYFVEQNLCQKGRKNTASIKCLKMNHYNSRLTEISSVLFAYRTLSVKPRLTYVKLRESRLQTGPIPKPVLRTLLPTTTGLVCYAVKGRFTLKDVFSLMGKIVQVRNPGGCSGLY
jgi:hypothetical protein